MNYLTRGYPLVAIAFIATLSGGCGDDGESEPASPSAARNINAPATNTEQAEAPDTTAVSYTVDYEEEGYGHFEGEFAHAYVASVSNGYGDLVLTKEPAADPCDPFHVGDEPDARLVLSVTLPLSSGDHSALLSSDDDPLQVEVNARAADGSSSTFGTTFEGASSGTLQVDAVNDTDARGRLDVRYTFDGGTGTLSGTYVAAICSEG